MNHDSDSSAMIAVAKFKKIYINQKLLMNSDFQEKMPRVFTKLCAIHDSRVSIAALVISWQNSSKRIPLLWSA